MCAYWTAIELVPLQTRSRLLKKIPNGNTSYDDMASSDIRLVGDLLTHLHLCTCRDVETS